MGGKMSPDVAICPWEDKNHLWLRTTDGCRGTSLKCLYKNTRLGLGSVLHH